MSALRRMLGIGAALAVGCVASVLLVELGVRVLLGEQVKFPRHVVGAPWGLRINEPHSTYRHKSADVTVWFRINGQGMRADRDFAYQKPAGVARIMSLGDSFTVGYEVNLEDSFSAVLERELVGMGIPVEVLNAGVSGYSNAEAYLYLKRELLKYDPDLVLLSFYGNDFEDNVRTGLFSLEGGRLIEQAQSYVPAGGLGDFLNTNPIFNVLSGYSDAFVLIKERLTYLVKRQMVQHNFEAVERAEQAALGRKVVEEQAPYSTELTVAILDAMYELCRSRNIPLVIQSIPYHRMEQDGLVEMFPVNEFRTDREGLHLQPMKPLLDPWVGREQLYYLRSHHHWTPFAHHVSGQALAALIAREGLLGAHPRTDPPVERTTSPASLGGSSPGS